MKDRETDPFCFVGKRNIYKQTPLRKSQQNEKALLAILKEDCRHFILVEAFVHQLTAGDP
jgi:hypothetical protein